MTTSIASIIAILSASTAATEVLCAVPYNSYTLPCFYFSSSEEYDQKLEAAKELDLIKNACGDFEHELQFIDGEGSQKLADSTNDMEVYFKMADQIGCMNEEQEAAFHLLTEHLDHSAADALESLEEIYLIQGTAADYAFDQVEEMGLEGLALTYFDYDQYARDLMLNGEIIEFRFKGEDYTAQNLS